MLSVLACMACDTPLRSVYAAVRPRLGAAGEFSANDRWASVTCPDATVKGLMRIASELKEPDSVSA